MLHADVSTTPYADVYRRLIQLARSNRIELALATFDMAVNEGSPEEVVDFTQPGRERLAGNLLAGIREILRTHPRLRCRPAA